MHLASPIGGLRRTGGASCRRRAMPCPSRSRILHARVDKAHAVVLLVVRNVALRSCTRTSPRLALTETLRGTVGAARTRVPMDRWPWIRSLCSGCGALSRVSNVKAWSNMRMQLTRPRGRWLKAGRLSNASLQLIRVR